MDWLSPDNKLTPPKPRTAADHVAEILREAIGAGSLPPGTVLRQDEVAKRFALSRMPVRDALRLLEAEGLVVIHPTRGACVARMDAKEIGEIYAVRELVEVEALRLAFPRFTQPMLRQADTILKQIDDEPDVGRWGILNRSFHMTLYSPCENSKLLAVIEAQHTLCDRYVRVLLSNLDYRTRSQDEHRELLDACMADDLSAGLRILVSHLSDGSRVLTQSIVTSGT